MSRSPAPQARGHVDLVTIDQRDDRLLPVAPQAWTAAEYLALALDGDGVDRLHLDLEKAFDGLLDLGLGRVLRDAEGHLAVLGAIGGLFRDQRRTDDFVHPRARDGFGRIPLGAHCRRSSRCFTASLVSTSVSRRR